MKIVTWNVNGLRAAMKKGFKDFFDEMDADIFAIQETKMQEDQKDFDFPGYYEYWSNAIKKGYSGTLIYTKKQPLNVTLGIDNKYSDEGRIITLEYEQFYFVNVYVPNSQRGLMRLDFRMEFEDDFRQYLTSLKKQKPVIVCGDLNVAHQEIDLKNPKTNTMNPGFTFEERNKFIKLLSSGFIDTYRFLYPTKIEYTWWSYMNKARERNIGWRIDYFLISDCLKNNLNDVIIKDQVLGSDHCPVVLDINL